MSAVSNEDKIEHRVCLYKIRIVVSDEVIGVHCLKNKEMVRPETIVEGRPLIYHTIVMRENYRRLK